jgi:hypothetical protein
MNDVPLRCMPVTHTAREVARPIGTVN